MGEYNNNIALVLVNAAITAACEGDDEAAGDYLRAARPLLHECDEGAEINASWALQRAISEGHVEVSPEGEGTRRWVEGVAEDDALGLWD